MGRATGLEGFKRWPDNFVEEEKGSVNGYQLEAGPAVGGARDAVTQGATVSGRGVGADALYKNP